MEVDNRAEWLEDLGACDGGTTLKVKCTWCDVKMACHLGTIQAHELSKRHKDQDKRREAATAGQQQMQQRLAAMQQHADTQRKKAQHDPATRTLFSSVLRAMQHGRPLTDVMYDKEFLEFNSAPDVPQHHWQINSGKVTDASRCK